MTKGVVKRKRSKQTMDKQYQSYCSDPAVEEVRIIGDLFYAKIGLVMYKNKQGRWFRQDEKGDYYSLFANSVPLNVQREYERAMR